MTTSSRVDVCLANPFEVEARTSSCYLGMTNEGLQRLRHKSDIDDGTRLLHDTFRSKVGERDYTCTGARSAFRRGAYRFGAYDTLGEANAGLAHDLFEFRHEQSALPPFSTFVACFREPLIESGRQFHELLFSQLQQLHEVDTESWDPTVSDDPEDPSYSFSMFGHGWFIVGLNAESERVARKFPHPVLVFNSHRQFEQLRETGQYQSMQRTIRARDRRLQPDGTINPNLGDFGTDRTTPEWRQASGLVLPEEEKCPLHIASNTSKRVS